MFGYDIQNEPRTSIVTRSIAAPFVGMSVEVAGSGLRRLSIITDQCNCSDAQLIISDIEIFPPLFG